MANVMIKSGPKAGQVYPENSHEVRMAQAAGYQVSGVESPAQQAAAPAPTLGASMPDVANTTTPFGTQLDAMGMLKPQFQAGFKSSIAGLGNLTDNIKLDKRGLEALRERGLSTGDSAWAKLMLEKQAMDEQDALGKAVRENRSGAAGAMSNLARSGGLSTGARERLSANAANQLGLAQQDVGRSGIMQRLGIRSDDENKRLDVLKMLPGAEVQSLQPELQKASMWSQMAQAEDARKQQLDLANIGNALGVKQNENAAQLQKYKIDMEKYAADQTAKAQAQAGGGGKK